MRIDTLRELFTNQKVKWSTHGLERMQEREITKADVRNCILYGEIIEDYPNDYPYPSCLIFGLAVNHEVIHVVAGSEGEFVYIITAYFPDLEKFEDDLKTRRER